MTRCCPAMRWDCSCSCTSRPDGTRRSGDGPLSDRNTGPAPASAPGPNNPGPVPVPVHIYIYIGALALGLFYALLRHLRRLDHVRISQR